MRWFQTSFNINSSFSKIVYCGKNNMGSCIVFLKIGTWIAIYIEMCYNPNGSATVGCCHSNHYFNSPVSTPLLDNKSNIWSFFLWLSYMPWPNCDSAVMRQNKVRILTYSVISKILKLSKLATFLNILP